MNTRLTKAEKLVLQGMTVKATLAEARVSSTSLCHIDWVSLTFKKQNIVDSDFYQCSQPVTVLTAGIEQDDIDGDLRIAKWLALRLAQIVGFEIGVLKRGINYYDHTVTLINDQGNEVACVSGGGETQRDTFNLVIRGAGCTYAKRGWQSDLVRFGKPLDAKVARVDLALDCFNGEFGGVAALRQAYLAGEFDYNKHRPSSAMAGDWDGGHSRTYNIGKRGSKSVCAYEKAHQFGIMDSSWWRCELRYGSADRVIPLEVLTEPDKFFAGAYPYLAELLDSVEPETIKTKTELKDMTAQAVVKRKCNWFERVVAPTIVHFTKSYSPNQGELGFMWLCDLAVKHADRELPRSLRDVPSDFLNSAIKKMLSFSETPSVPAGMVAT